MTAALDPRVLSVLRSPARTVAPRPMSERRRVEVAQHRALAALVRDCAHRFQQIYQAGRLIHTSRVAYSQAKYQLAREYRGYYRTLHRAELYALTNGEDTDGQA